MDFYDEVWRNETNGGALQKWISANGIYIDTRTEYTTLSSIPQDWIDKAVNAAEKIKKFK